MNLYSNDPAENLLNGVGIMKQFTGLLLFVSTSVITAGCSSPTASLTGRDPFKTNGDPFQAAAAMSQGETHPQTEVPARPSAPGYAVVNGAASRGSAPGWSTTRHAPPMGSFSGAPQQPPQTAAVSQNNVQMTFRAATSLPESQTQVVNSPAVPEQQAGIPAIGDSASREPVSDDPFEQGGVTNADFMVTEEENITQLGAERPVQASPATLEMPVFTDDPEQEDPFNASPTPPAKAPEWWQQ